MGSLAIADRIVNDEILWRGLCEALWRGTALGRYAPQPTGSASKGAEKGSHGIGSYSNDISEFDSRGSSGSSSSSSSSSQNSAHPIGAMVGSDDYGGSENPLFGQWALCRCSRTPLDREQAVFTTLPLPRALAQRTAARRSWKQAGAAEAASTAGSARLGGDGGASAAGDEALLLEAVCEEVRLLSYRESYLASFKDRLRVRIFFRHTSREAQLSLQNSSPLSEAVTEIPISSIRYKTNHVIQPLVRSNLVRFLIPRTRLS